MKLALAAFASLLSSSAALAGDESLLPLRTWNSGYGARTLAAADLDGNGRKDVISLYTPDDEGPTFLAAFSLGPHGDILSQHTKVVNTAIRLGAADFDGDGFEDLALPYYWGYVFVYRGAADGGLTLWQSIKLPQTTQGIRDIEVADFNDDNWPDILICKEDPASLAPFKMLRNLGGTGFEPVTSLAATGLQPSRMALADLNGDGKLDVLAAESSTDVVRVLRANFSGISFTDLGTLPMIDDVGEVCALDLSGDGVPDMAAAILGPSAGLTVQPGTGGGSFGAPTHTLAAGAGAILDTGDIDGDGDIDIVQGSDENGTWGYANSSSLPLAAPKGIHTEPHTIHMVMADVNGDGWSDLVAAPYHDKGLTLVYGGSAGLQTPAASTLIVDAMNVLAADFTGDGQPDVLAVGGNNNKQIRLSAGNGDGSFAAAVGTTNTFTVVHSTVARCNGDALNDLVVLASTFDGLQVKLMLNLGASQKFQAGDQELLGATAVAGVLAADLDGDGALEICVPTAAGEVRVWHVDGSSNLVLLGSVALPEIVGCSLAVSPMAAGDLNEDGLLDVAFARQDLEQVFVLPGQPGGMLGAATILDVSPELNITQVLVGDVNDDGLADLLGMGWGTTTVWAGQPGLQFAAPQTSAGGWHEPHLADVNADGRPDLVSFKPAYIGDPSHISVQLGLGNGQFATASRFLAGAVHLDVADFDSDGATDVVILADDPGLGAPDSDEASVFLSQPFTPFVDLGYALPGSKGDPEFLAWGWLQPGQTATLSVARAKPLAPAALFVGLSQALLPFKGGTLVPSIDLLLPAFFTDGQGRLELELPWPASVPSGLSFTMQWWFADASGPAGFSASNALTATTP